MSETTVFDRLGGEPGVRALVDAFYDRMDQEPRYAKLRELHPPVLNGSRNKLYWYLCGWTGGPQHYQERFGHPRVRARHMPFTIDTEGRDQWLSCMGEAMDQVSIDPRARAALWPPLAELADWMRNQPEA
jgi:hemoglobin